MSLIVAEEKSNFENTCSIISQVTPCTSDVNARIRLYGYINRRDKERGITRYTRL